MLRSLVKIANKLDSLGLTKEADVVDRFILKMAQMEEVVEPEMEEEVDPKTKDASSRVRDAIAATTNPNGSYMKHFLNAFITRNPSKESEGSTFIDPQTPDSLIAATWKPYNHPDVIPPAVAFRADIPGRFGIIELKNINESTPAEIVKSHKGAENPDGSPIEAACIIPKSVASMPESSFTTILLGPEDEKDEESKEIVYTFFPGPPINSRKTEKGNSDPIFWTQELAKVTTVGGALEAGFKYGKLGGS